MNRFEGITREDLEALQQLIAERMVQRGGPHRIITQEILQERCWHYTEIAKRELQACGPEGNPDKSGFIPTATVFGADGQEAPNVPVPYDVGQKRHKMWALSQTCRTILAQAVLLRHVATLSNMQELAKVMNLNCPDPRDFQKYKYFEERMWKWIEKNYGSGRLSSLPPELRHDVILVTGFGPKLQDAAVITPYRWENGKLIFDKSESEGMMRLDMIPRWWQ